MTIFESLFLAHVLGDWILQNEWQALNKRTSWRALLTHVLIYHIIILVVLIAQVGAGRPEVYAVVVALAIVHGALDRHGVEPLMRALHITVHREPDRLLMVAVDQSLHLLTLGAASLLLS